MRWLDFRASTFFFQTPTAFEIFKGGKDARTCFRELAHNASKNNEFSELENVKDSAESNCVIARFACIEV
jgi:hypothetical protein